MSEHITHLRLRRQVHYGKCAVCRESGRHLHYDADFMGAVCQWCVAHVKNAEIELLNQHLTQPPEYLLHL